MHFFVLDAVFAEKKNPGGHGDTVEKGLGPRLLGAHRAHILLLKPTTFRAGEQDFFWEKKASPKKPGVFIKKMTYFFDFLLFWQMLT